MKTFLRYAAPIFALLGLAIFHYPSPTSVASETRKLNCVFEKEIGGAPVRVAASGQEIGRINFDAKLSDKFIHDDTELWRAEGIATFGGTSQELRGPVFLRSGNKVRGLALYRDRYPRQNVDLQISTLNKTGKLDWNEQVAFAYFGSMSNKLAHPYTFRCDVTDGG